MQTGAPSSAPVKGRPRLLRIATAIEDGDIGRACRLMEAEVRKEPSSRSLRLQLARLKEASGDREGAAAEYTRALRHWPDDSAAGAAFGRLLADGRLTSHAGLDPIGFAACLTHKTVDRDLLGAAALEFIVHDGSLKPVFAHARSHGMEAAVRAALGRRAAPLLRDPLLISVLENCTVSNSEVERALTAVRRALVLDIPRERFNEPDLLRFTTALAMQCWSNEYVFAAGSDELDALGPPPSTEAVRAGDGEACRALLLQSLFRHPLSMLADDITDNVRPDVFSAFLRMLIEERDEIRALSTSIVRMGAIEQAISLKVRAQYETHPYPRWRSTALFPGDRFADYLESFFEKRELTFLGAPFELLVAGCGTGLQVVSAALDYGPKAHVTGLDISAASLGYTALMARRFDVRNIALVHGDIDRVETFEPRWKGRFHVVECCGVLHHMADPFAAWRRLLDCLAPGGIMLVGLYSQAARRDLEALRQLPDYPGPEADDTALRRYRHHLVSRGPDALGAHYLKARDTFTTSGFRDFFLHVSEKTTTIADIKSFLDENGLAFRGFVNVPFGLLAKRFPGESWPGRLERWAELEAERPDLFIGMYQFWLTRR
jgi:SAM-dependent methyltransferase